MKSFPFFAALGVCALAGFCAQADVVDLTYRVSAPGSNELVNIGGTSCALTNRAPDDARELPKFNAERPCFGRVFVNRLVVLDKSSPDGRVWDTLWLDCKGNATGDLVLIDFDNHTENYAQLSGRPVTLAAGAQTEEFTLKPLAPTKITVLDEAGKPVAKATFRRLSAIIATTDDKGQALIRLQPPSGRDIGIRVESDSGDLIALLENPAADAKEMTVTLRKSATLTGLVKKPDGSPLAGANAQLIWHTGNMGMFEEAVKTDAEGRYKISNLIPGASYIVQVTCKGYGTNGLTMKPVTPGADAMVEVAPITLAAATAALSGRLTDPAGAPVANMQVSLRSPRNERKSVMTDKDGRFKMEELVPEEVWLSGQMPDAGPSLFSRRVAPEEFANLAIVVQPQFDPRAQLAVNTPAPELKELDWIQGEWKGFAGRRTVVAFVSIKTRNSREVIKDMQAAVERAKDGSLAGVLVHDSTAMVDEIKDFMAQNKITLTVGRVMVEADTGLYTPAFRAYKVGGTPAVFIVNARGLIEAANVAPSELSAQLEGQTE